MSLEKEVSEVFEACRSIIKDRQSQYKDGYLKESLDYFITNISRKEEGVRYQLREVGTGSEKLLEQLVDLINYSATCYLKIKKLNTRIKLGIECPTPWIYLLEGLSDFEPVLAYRNSDKSYMQYILSTKKLKVVNARWLKSIEEVSKEVKEGKECVKRCTTPVDNKVLADVIEQIQLQYIIAPDYYPQDNQNPTKRTIEEYLSLKDFLAGRDIEVIGVLQGTKSSDIDKCLRHYGKQIAIPYDVLSRWEDPQWKKMINRASIVDACKDREIYLLGMNDLEELTWYSDLKQVKFLATSLPVKRGLELKDIAAKENKIYSSMLEMPGYPITLSRLDFVCKNIEKVRLALGGFYEP